MKSKLRLREIDLTDPEQGTLLLLAAFPRDEAAWGDLQPLQGTSWQQGVSEVTAAALSHALHGYATPLVRQLGRPPLSSAKKVSPEEGFCALQAGCIGWDSVRCRPCAKTPECYEAPLEGFVFRRVAEAWKERRHVVVVIGNEFALT
jgi:hypothetical protein